MTSRNYASTMLLSHLSGVVINTVSIIRRRTRVNPFNTDVLIVVIERKVTADIEFNAVIDFIVFTEGMVFMCDAVIDGERLGGPGQVNQPFSTYRC